MIYLGRSKHVSLEYKDEIKVYQQYCGTENICVYRGELMEGGEDGVREFILILAELFFTETSP